MKEEVQVKKSLRGKGEIPFSPAEVHMMKTMYNYKFTMKQISDKFMCSRETIRKHLVK